MARVVTLNGSPSATSRTAALLNDLARTLAQQGHEVVRLNLRELPPGPLLAAQANEPAIAQAVKELEQAEGVVVGTPIYKAAYTGLLKAFLDLLPQFALTGKTVLPLATGGSVAHVLALDYALRPVLSSLAARHIVGSYFILDKTITVHESGKVELDATIEPKYRESVEAFTESLRIHGLHGATSASAASR